MAKSELWSTPLTPQLSYWCNILRMLLHHTMNVATLSVRCLESACWSSMMRWYQGRPRWVLTCTLGNFPPTGVCFSIAAVSLCTWREQSMAAIVAIKSWHVRCVPPSRIYQRWAHALLQSRSLYLHHEQRLVSAASYHFWGIKIYSDMIMIHHDTKTVSRIDSLYGNIMIRMIFIFQSPDGMAQSSVMGSPSMAFLRKFERSFEARLCCPQNGSVPSSTAATRIDIRGTSLWDGHHNHSMIQPFDERNMIWYKLCYMNIYIYIYMNLEILE